MAILDRKRAGGSDEWRLGIQPCHHGKQLKPWERLKTYFFNADTAPSEFFSLVLRFWWGIGLLLQPWTSFGFTPTDVYTAAPHPATWVLLVVGVFLIATSAAHAYSILWEHRCLRRCVLLIVVFWWATVTVNTVFVAGPGVRAISTAMFGLWMGWAYWRRSPIGGAD